MLHVVKADCAMRKVEQHFATSSLKSDTILLTRGSLTFPSSVDSSRDEGLKNKLERDTTPDLCNAGALLYELGYHANLELVVMWVDHNLVHDGHISIYKI